MRRVPIPHFVIPKVYLKIWTGHLILDLRLRLYFAWHLSSSEKGAFNLSLSLVLFLSLALSSSPIFSLFHALPTPRRPLVEHCWLPIFPLRSLPRVRDSAGSRGFSTNFASYPSFSCRSQKIKGEIVGNFSFLKVKSKVKLKLKSKDYS